MEKAILTLFVCGGMSFIASIFTISAAMLSSRISQRECEAEWGSAQPRADKPATDQPPLTRPSSPT